MPQNAPSPDRDAFALRLAAARKIRGYRQAELADLIGVARPRYHSWENATATPNRIEIYWKLCRCLDVTVEWLFFGNVTNRGDERAVDGRD